MTSKQIYAVLVCSSISVLSAGCSSDESAAVGNLSGAMPAIALTSPTA